MKKIDNVKEFFEYETCRFWIAIVAVILVHFIPFGDTYIGMLLLRALWQETGSILFFLGMIAVEFVIIIVPFILVQRFFKEKCNFK